MCAIIPNPSDCVNLSSTDEERNGIVKMAASRMFESLGYLRVQTEYPVVYIQLLVLTYVEEVTTSHQRTRGLSRKKCISLLWAFSIAMVR